MEGVVDAAFFEDAPEPAWMVVDFKTDAELADLPEHYRRQVLLYGLAVWQATGTAVRGVLFRV